MTPVCQCARQHMANYRHSSHPVYSISSKYVIYWLRRVFLFQFTLLKKTRSNIENLCIYYGAKVYILILQIRDIYIYIYIYIIHQIIHGNNFTTISWHKIVVASGIEDKRLNFVVNVQLSFSFSIKMEEIKSHCKTQIEVYTCFRATEI